MQDLSSLCHSLFSIKLYHVLSSCHPDTKFSLSASNHLHCLSPDDLCVLCIYFAAGFPELNKELMLYQMTNLWELRYFQTDF